MSKLWLLLLAVVAFQAVHSYPAYDYLEDDEQSTWGILKDTFGKLKDLYTEKSKAALKKLTDKLREKLCDDIEVELEEPNSAEADEEEVIPVKLNVLQRLRELLSKLQQATNDQKEKVKEEIHQLKLKVCAKLGPADEDEDRFNWGILGNKIKDGFKKALTKLKPALKKAAKKGMQLMKDNGVKVTPMECEGKSCKTCIRFMAMSACLRSTMIRTNKNTYFKISGELNDVQKFEERIALGDVPKCVKLGGAIGNICLKGLEGKGKSSKGKAQVNFCLGFLAEQHGLGVKVCASYENKKFDIKLQPEVFAGGLDDNGDIVIADKKDEDKGTTFDADEFVIEE